MIILIDIVILIFITYFSISKSIKSDSLTEISKLISMIVGILGAIFLYPSLLQNLILNLSSSLFDINKNQMDFNFFYMISFFIQFFIIYFIASIFASYIKSFAHLKPNSIVGKISIIFACIIRSILIVIMVIYTVESFPSHMTQSKNKLQESVTYKTLSKISHIIIK